MSNLSRKIRVAGTPRNPGSPRSRPFKKRVYQNAQSSKSKVSNVAAKAHRSFKVWMARYGGRHAPITRTRRA